MSACPRCAAQVRAMHPWCSDIKTCFSVASFDLKARTISPMTSVRECKVAMCKAVWPYEFFFAASAPLCSKRATTAAWPASAAVIRAVYPSSKLVLTVFGSSCSSSSATFASRSWRPARSFPFAALYICRAITLLAAVFPFFAPFLGFSFAAGLSLAAIAASSCFPVSGRSATVGAFTFNSGDWFPAGETGSFSNSTSDGVICACSNDSVLNLTTAGSVSMLSDARTSHGTPQLVCAPMALLQEERSLTT
mmetsp:Transcript_70765/g.124844  ORF Transcript_70765/g.124844 Transcript_70765/m.124844 type:complete len:250 (+) Transcript_70765:461-1210(+)